MPRRLVLFVEGKGDLAAVPKLAARVLAEIGGHDALFVDDQPFRVGNLGSLVGRNGKWLQWLHAAARTRSNLGGVLLVLDGDIKRVPDNWAAYAIAHGAVDFCARRAARALVEDASPARGGDAFSVAAVFAMQEFEAWLVAGIEGLRGRSLPGDRGIVGAAVAAPGGDPETTRDAKGLLRQRVPEYQETLDQGFMAQHVALEMVHQKCRSFRSFESASQRLVDAIRTGRPVRSPPGWASGLQCDV